MKVRRSITINRSPDDVYFYWHDFESLPVFMTHLQSVEVTGVGRSHWTANGPAGKTFEWDAEIVSDEPGRQISWRSVEGSEIENSGTVYFRPAPAGQGTEVVVEMNYDPPAGKAGAAIAALFGEEPNQQVRDDLRRLKQVLETGELVRSEGSLTGTGTPIRAQREAQPLDRSVEEEQTTL
jgi:uncharacterized membrane protein